ncbi:putative DNA-binding transcriptional regulator AlpA [Afipia massiliensis]|uniref:Putative DNA-binding transcriptional regulator AlpA n=1 Tax=Afipia massiliensis TaxID=211460 RepID=A0A840MYY3_9BRAD|nr:helix-turn-helix domain-containing protein [Afipia massiliensis]MBB5053065.1 putative DNA-binding transcriptional regulator AlpA [Afipia massiliensis]
MTDETPPRLLTQKAAAAYLGVSTPTFVKWVMAGIIPNSVGSTRKWDKKAIDLALDKISGLDEPKEKQDSYREWKLRQDARRARHSKSD